MFSRTVFAAIAASALALSGCGVAGPAHTPLAPLHVDAMVTMPGATFAPETIRIRPGQTVLWRNTSVATHTVTADPGLVANPANVRLPQGAQPFHSGEIRPGQVWSRTFTVPGIYRYVCLPHERQGMVGMVLVE